jgi:hypothetical protein
VSECLGLLLTDNLEKEIWQGGGGVKSATRVSPLFTAAAAATAAVWIRYTHVYTYTRPPSSHSHREPASERASCGEAAKSLSTRRVNGIHTSKYARRSRILTASSHTQQLCFLVCLPNELSRSTGAPFLPVLFLRDLSSPHFHSERKNSACRGIGSKRKSAGLLDENSSAAKNTLHMITHFSSKIFSE